MAGKLGICLGFVAVLILIGVDGTAAFRLSQHSNAYATMMYMGTPRDYEFYVATRVMLRSLRRLKVDADLVVIASMDVPLTWIQTLEDEDEARVIRVENMKNPYGRGGRFKLTLNKIYAWSLVDYERVIMLDSDNLFLQKTDELFQCGEFCAAFINPCIFHTGLFVLQPSMEVFKDMVHDIEVARSNPDGYDQGFIGGYFPDLLDKPLFHPPSNGTKLDGQYRLPLGYQMDASYYYLKLHWSVPCGPNSVITFPGAPWLKPWYWWSYPVLPLGLQWHEQRLDTLGYSAEMPIVLLLSLLFISLIPMSKLARPSLAKLCYRPVEKSATLIQTGVKLAAIWSILAAYLIPFVLIPHTIYPIIGWGLYLLGTFSLSSIAINAFLLPTLPVITPLIGIFGTLLVMACPWYSDGVVRALAVFFYAFCFSPILWASMVKIASSLQGSPERELFIPRSLVESARPSWFNNFSKSTKRLNFW